MTILHPTRQELHEREDLVTTMEQGRRAERGLSRETFRKMDTLGNLLNNRHFSGREDVRVWEKRNSHAPLPEITPAGPNPHGWECLCDRCHEGFKWLMRDVLPEGWPDWASLTAEPIAGRVKIPARYRRDESDR